MTIWITSDTHFGHAQIITYCSRPFASAEEMDEALIQRWNEVVRPGDHVYHLGDVMMLRGGQVQQAVLARLIGRLAGHKRLLLGNHDHFPVEAYVRAGFEKVRGTGQWLDGLLLSHYPVHPLSLGRAQANVHGHTHARDPFTPVLVPSAPGLARLVPYVNVCVERTLYRPVSLEEVKAMASTDGGVRATLPS